MTVPPPDGRLRVLFAGDSLTLGAFALDPDRDAFPALVTAELGRFVGVTTRQIGGNGHTAAMVLPPASPLPGWP